MVYLVVSLRATLLQPDILHILCIRMVPNSSELSINIDFLSEYFFKSLKII